MQDGKRAVSSLRPPDGPRHFSNPLFDCQMPPLARCDIKPSAPERHRQRDRYGQKALEAPVSGSIIFFGIPFDFILFALTLLPR